VSRTDYTMAVLSVTVLGLGRSPLRPRTYASVNGSRALTTGAARPSNINLYILASRDKWRPADVPVQAVGVASLAYLFIDQWATLTVSLCNAAG